MKYNVIVAVDITGMASVEADSKEEALRKAEQLEINSLNTGDITIDMQSVTALDAFEGDE